MKKIILAAMICGAGAATLTAKSGIPLPSCAKHVFQDNGTKQDDKTKQTDKNKTSTQGTQDTGNQNDMSGKGGQPQSVQVPENVKTIFNNAYPNTNATWSMDGNNYMATYSDPDTRMGRIVVYDKSGNVVRSESEMNSGFPEGIGNYYKKNYPNEKNYTVWQSDMGNKRSYYTKYKGRKMRFDKDGNYMKGEAKDDTKMNKNDMDKNMNESDNMKK